MGFKDEVAAIVAQCKHPKRQTIMVSATLNQDLKELAEMALHQALTFTVQQQQRKADLANLKLTQYLVRLQFDDVEKMAKSKEPVQTKDEGKPKKKVDFMDADFDSEAEYASDNSHKPGQDSEDEVEYVGGGEGAQKSSASEDSDLDDAELGESEITSFYDEEGEAEMTDSELGELEEGEAEMSESDGDGYQWVRDDANDSKAQTKPDKRAKKSQAESEESSEEEVFVDKY